MAWVFDVETNGLLDELDKIHCLVITNTETLEVETYAPHSIEEGLRSLLSKDLVVGHNVICFDIPAIQKCYPQFEIDQDKVLDTLVLSRLLHPNLMETDCSSKNTLPSKMRGSHALGAWGHRMGCHKGDYKGGWETFSQEMLDYCVQDTTVTVELLKRLKSKRPSKQSVDLEHQVQWLIARQERHGFLFDERKALDLCAKLQKRRAEIEAGLQTVFSPWWSLVEEVTPSRSINYKHRATVSAGASYSKIKLNVFNPGSRFHVADRLQKLGWEPKDFTNDGHPKVDETTLMGISFTQGKLMAEYFMLTKRLGMLSDGKKSWLGSLKGDRLHGSVICNGTVTGRASMRSPNLQQVPSVSAAYGKECRELFKVPEGKSLVGVDMSGIELRMLGHFTAPLDGGAYAKEVVDGDIHTHNQRAAGLDSRDISKRFIYAFIYGAGINKLAEVTSLTKRETAKVKARYLENNPGLGKLLSLVQDKAKSDGYLLGLDKRRLHCRSPHSALNVLLQSAGAICAKRWLVEFDREVEERGWRQRVQQVAWIHDEIQIECDAELSDDVGQTAVAAIEAAGKNLNIRVPITGEFNVGSTWADTH